MVIASKAGPQTWAQNYSGACAVEFLMPRQIVVYKVRKFSFLRKTGFHWQGDAEKIINIQKGFLPFTNNGKKINKQGL
jgi:hypothetical protein